MRLRIVDIDLFLDYKLRQNKGARGQPLPFVKYLGRFNTPKGAAMRNERNAMNWPIGLAAIAVFYDLLLYSTGCKARGVLADSDGGFTVEWLHGECKCPVDVLPEVIRLLIRYGWLADDDNEIQPSMQTGKVNTAPPDVSASPWAAVAEKLVQIWLERFGNDKTPGASHVEDLLIAKYHGQIELAALILANAKAYAPSHARYALKLQRWIAEDKGTLPLDTSHERKLEPVKDDGSIEAWEEQMRIEHAEGKISDEAMRAWGLL